jgi:hypothetical protein
MTDGKPHVSVVLFGHVDCGKSTIAGSLKLEGEDPALLHRLFDGDIARNGRSLREVYLRTFQSFYLPWTEREPRLYRYGAG